MAGPELISRQLLDNVRELTIAGSLPVIEDMGTRIVCPHVEVHKLDDAVITKTQWHAVVRTFPSVHIFRTAALSVPVLNALASSHVGWPELDMIHMLSLLLHHYRVRRVELEVPRKHIPRCDLSPWNFDMLRCVSPVALTSWLNDDLLDCVGKELHVLRLVKCAGN